MEEMRSAVGRMGFAAEVLEYERPFLGPLYAWMSSVPEGAYLDLPAMVRLIFRWLSDRWTARRHLPCRLLPVARGELFRADAKAEGELVVLGGWECSGGLTTQAARWWSLQLDRDSALWAYVPKEPQRRIAALELLASLLCLMLFVPVSTEAATGRMRLSGGTDNRGNGYVMDKFMTSAFPLNVVLMETSAQLERRSLSLMLDWVPREKNQEADDLTNFKFGEFAAENRITVRFEELEFLVLREMMVVGEGLYQEVAELRGAAKRERAENPLAGCRRGRKKKKKKAPLRVSDPW
jgi:hypothetical protein